MNAKASVFDEPVGIRVILSDIHMGQGSRPGFPNPYEEFHEDVRLAELIAHYAAEQENDSPVELILNGDMLDLLRIPFQGRFVTEVTEEIAKDKVVRCLRGHPEVFDALSSFCSRPNRRIVWIAGNHDLDIAFPGVQDILRARLGLPLNSPALIFCTDSEFWRLPGGVVVTHGHHFQANSRPDGGFPLKELPNGQRIVNMPWSSTFVLNVLAPAKVEQPLIDRVHPLSAWMLWGLLFDFHFTLRMLWKILRFHLETPMDTSLKESHGLLKSIQILIEEMSLHDNLGTQALRLLESSDDISVLIVAHSHQARIRRLLHGKTLINTGTWEKIVSLNLRDLGPKSLLTFGVVEYSAIGLPLARLMRWRGTSGKMEEMRL